LGEPLSLFSVLSFEQQIDAALHKELL